MARRDSRRITSNPYTRVARQLTDNPHWIPVIAEGDSWFSFPGLLMRMNVIGHLQRTFEARMAMLRIAHSGDRVAEILSGRQKRTLRRALKHHFGFRMLIFSGGGNDIVDAMPRILRRKEPGMGWRACINDAVVGREIDKIRAAYTSLIGMRDRHNPTCHIFTHCYDFPTVNGEPIRILGKRVRRPPLQPRFVNKNILNNADQRKIVRHVLAEFHGMLEELPDSTQNPFTVVDTTKTLHPTHWQDEMHPSTKGFGLIAKKIGQQIVKHFPRAIPKSALQDFR